MTDLLLIFFAVVIGGFLLACLAVLVYILKQGNAKFEFLVRQRGQFELINLSKDSATFTVLVPFINSGSQDGMLLDVFPRHLLPIEQFDKVKVESYISRDDIDRSDGYWEAVIIPKRTGGAVKVTVKFTAKDGDIFAALKEMVDMHIELIRKIVSRKEVCLEKTLLIMPKEEIKGEMEKTLGALREGEANV